MKVLVHTAADPAELSRKLSGQAISFASIHVDCDVSVELFQNVQPNAAIHGATSCLGAMTNGSPSEPLVAFTIHDPDGAYGSAMVPFEGDVRSASALAVTRALESADRVGEQPEMVWIAATPGSEETVLAGIQDVVGREVPIIGGSAADNDVSGNWFLFDQSEKISEGVVVSVLFPSTPVSFAYQNGYAPTKRSGIATSVAGRQILEIDGRPAVDVYDEWSEGAISSLGSQSQTTTILSDSTLWPLGREVSRNNGVPFYLLAHPAVALETGALELFATVDEGEELTAMTGSISGLTERAGRVASLAKSAVGQTDFTVAGALMIYCGGCMLTVKEQLSDVVSGVSDAIEDAPFVGAYTFGEQGALVGSGNRHGNLMISCIVFWQEQPR